MASGEGWPCSGKRLWWLSQYRRRAVRVLLEEIERHAAAPCGIVSEPEIRGDTGYDHKDDPNGQRRCVECGNVDGMTTSLTSEFGGYSIFRRRVFCFLAMQGSSVSERRTLSWGPKVNEMCWGYQERKKTVHPQIAAINGWDLLS